MLAAYPEIHNEKYTCKNNQLEKDIVDDTSGPFKKLLRALCVGARRTFTREQVADAVVESDMGGYVLDTDLLVPNKDLCREEAKKMYEAGEGKFFGTNEEEFNRIICWYDYYHLKQIFKEYTKITQRDVLNSIDREFSGDIKKGLEAVVLTVRSRPLFFARRLNDAIRGLGTDDRTLIRIIVSRAEIDMKQIKEAYLKEFNRTLWKDVGDDTRGDYMRILQALVKKD